MSSHADLTVFHACLVNRVKDMKKQTVTSAGHDGENKKTAHEN